MFDLLEPYSGHYYEAKYLEWDENNETYKPPISLLIKGHSAIGVSSGIKEETQVEGSRWVSKHTFTIYVSSDIKPKVKDKFELENDMTYVVLRVSPDVNHPNAMANLMFQNINLPKVVYLGDK